MTVSNDLPAGWRFKCVPEIKSTNAEVLKLAAGGEEEGLVLRAEQQTKGRGRRGRSWASPKGNLYLSILINAPLVIAGQVSFAAALALYDAIELVISGDTSGLMYKWPNDLILDGAKVAGVLLEAVPDRDQVVVGFGVNVVPTEVENALYPVGSLTPGTVLVELDTLAFSICRALESWLKKWRDMGFAPLRKSWLDRAQGLHQPILVQLPNESLNGTFENLAEDGGLIIRQGGGAQRVIQAGDVFFSPRKET